jgi:hypothetical protein
MSGSRTPRAGRLLIAGATLALAATTLGATSASAANESRITFVNGIPGVPIDICLKAQQVKYGLKSGHVTTKIRDNGSHKLKVFKKKAGGCNGVKLAETTISVSYQDLTVVITRGAPKVLIFDNTSYTTGVGGSVIVYRHAADLGPVAFHHVQSEIISPAADPVWLKGDESAFPFQPGRKIGLMVTRPGQTADLASPKYQISQDQRRHEWVLIGTKGSNAKIVPFSRSYWSPLGT